MSVPEGGPDVGEERFIKRGTIIKYIRVQGSLSEFPLGELEGSCNIIERVLSEFGGEGTVN